MSLTTSSGIKYNVILEQSLQIYVINHIIRYFKYNVILALSPSLSLSLSRAVQMLNFHLHDVLGVAKWTDSFGSLGLLPAAVQGKQMNLYLNIHSTF